jgi:hypothetical protein
VSFRWTDSREETMKTPEHPYRISQIAVVVKDIDKAMKTY